MNGTLTKRTDMDDLQDRVLDLVELITYKPNFEILVRRDERVYVQVQCWRPDAFTGEMAYGRGGKIYLSPYMVDGEIVRKVFQAILSYEEHEVREFFEYKQVKVFGPHIAIEALVEAGKHLETRA
jgi:hypothetical protein